MTTPCYSFLFFKEWTFFKIFIYLFVCAWSPLWHVGFFFFFQLQHAGSSSLTRAQTWSPCIGSTVLTTGPLGKSLESFFLVKYSWFTVLLFSTVQQSDSLFIYMYIYTHTHTHPFLIFFSIIVYHRAFFIVSFYWSIIAWHCCVSFSCTTNFGKLRNNFFLI